MERPFATLATVAVVALLLVPAAAARDLVFATHPPGSLYQRAAETLAGAMAPVAGDPLRTRPYAGPAAVVAALDSGGADFALVLAGDLPDTDEAPGWSRVRLLAAVMHLPAGIAVAAAGPVRRIADLRGRSVAAVFADQPAVGRLGEAILAGEGLVPGDVRPVAVRSLFAGAYALGRGEVEATVAMPGIDALRWAADRLAPHGGVRFLPVPETGPAVAAMRRHLPVGPVRVETADGSTAVLAGYPVFLAARVNLSDPAARDIVRAMAAALPGLRQSDPDFRRTVPGPLRPPAPLPYHRSVPVTD